MEITLFDGDTTADVPTKQFIASAAVLFNSPGKISEAMITNISKIHTSIINHLYLFECEERYYLTFDAENNLTNETGRELLESVSVLKDVKGGFCPVKEGVSGSDFGLSDDDDPIDAGFTYLWHCGKVIKAVTK